MGVIVHDHAVSLGGLTCRWATPGVDRLLGV